MPEDFRLSQLAETLTGSEIVRMNGEIRQRMGEGHKVFNLTIGDFDPQLFPIPAELEEEIVFAYRKHLTNYPASEGEPDLRKAIARYITERRGLSYGMDEILVASGGRPLIYTLYRSIVDPGSLSSTPCPPGTTIIMSISWAVPIPRSSPRPRIALCPLLRICARI